MLAASSRTDLVRFMVLLIDARVGRATSDFVFMRGSTDKKVCNEIFFVSSGFPQTLMKSRVCVIRLSSNPNVHLGPNSIMDLFKPYNDMVWSNNNKFTTTCFRNNSRNFIPSSVSTSFPSLVDVLWSRVLVQSEYRGIFYNTVSLQVNIYQSSSSFFNSRIVVRSFVSLSLCHW